MRTLCTPSVLGPSPRAIRSLTQEFYVANLDVAEVEAHNEVNVVLDIFSIYFVHISLHFKSRATCSYMSKDFGKKQKSYVF